MYLYFLAHDVFLILIGLSMLGGDTMKYLYMFLVSLCATLIIELFLCGYS